MNRFPLALVCCLLFNLNAFATDACQRTQEEISKNLTDKSSRLSFKNSGGLFGGGVCWWHNRLQRSSAYLVEFRPHLPAPSEFEVYKILQSLREMNQIVTIPGYKDFNSFSKDYQSQIQTMLEEWQRIDGFLNFQWIRGISGHSRLSAKKMHERMDLIFKYVMESPVPVWIMAQIRGITSHSLLILDMKPAENGYVLRVIDSNHPMENVVITYHVGDTALKGKNNKYTFVPYSGFQKDFRKILYALKQECQTPDDKFDTHDIPEGEIEF